MERQMGTMAPEEETVVEIREDLYQEVIARAAEEGCTEEQIVETALRAYLSQGPQEPFSE